MTKKPEDLLLDLVFPLRLTKTDQETLLRHTLTGQSVINKDGATVKGARNFFVRGKVLVDLKAEIVQAAALADKTEKKRLRDVLETFPALLTIFAEDEPDSTPAEPQRASEPTNLVYQFKISLIGIEPTIWRRIQIPDCTLGRLHQYIQTAFGWTDTHLHFFQVDDVVYGSAEADSEDEDEDGVLLSDLLPEKTRKKIRWYYEYDFGDSWGHEILYEGVPPVDPAAKYPQCLEGARACPPEDIGGAWGYQNFVEAVTDRKHPNYRSMREGWGAFKPELFSAAKTTKAMRKVGSEDH